MEFEWDQEKHRRNRQKHEIGFEEAALIFQAPTVSKTDDRRDYGEIRTVSMGGIAPKLVVAVVHTNRKGRIRVISARLANRKERRQYHDHRSKIT